MTADSLDISDRLEKIVREALNNALAPYHAKHFVGMSPEAAIARISEWDRDQHRGARMAGVVAPIGSQTFRLTPKRQRRRVR